MAANRTHTEAMLFNQQSSYFPAPGRPGLTGVPGRSPQAAELAVLALILAAACLSRFFALDVPALLDAEGTLLRAIQESYSHILRRSLSSDVHPPFFAFLYKLAMPSPSSDFAARSLSAAVGVLGVYALYHVGARLFSRQTGLVAASILCVDLMHVALSREARPLALVMLMATVSAYRLIRFLDRPTWTNAWLLILAALLTAPWHSSAVLPLAAIALALGVALLLGAAGGGAGVLALIGVLNCMALGLTPFLARFGEPLGAAAPGAASLAFTAVRIFRLLQDLLDPPGLPYVWLGLGALCIAGFFALWRERPRLCAALTALCGLPVLLLLALRTGALERPEHLAFLLPPVLLFAARGVQAIPVSGALLAVFITLGGAYGLYIHKHASLYEADSGTPGHGRSPRGLAFALPAPLGGGMLFAADPPGLYGLAVLELERSGLGDPRLGVIGPELPALDFLLLHKPLHDGRKETSATSLKKAGYPKLPERTLENGFLLEGFAVPRTPSIPVDALPATFTLSADPAFFLSRVRSARDVTVAALPTGSAIIASRFGQPGSFTLRIENATGQAIPVADVSLDAAALAPGDRVELSCSFDGAPPAPSLALVYGGQPVPALKLGRAAPFSTLDVTITLHCAGERPGLDNIPDSARFFSMTVALDAPGSSLSGETSETAKDSSPSR